MTVSLYEEVLGPTAFLALPAPIRALHDTRPSKRFEGMTTIRRGYGLVTGLAARLFGLPAAGDNVPTSVVIECDAHGETWTRHFGGSVLRSRLTRPSVRKPGRITESVGRVSFDIDLDACLGRLYYPIGRAKIGSSPLPWFLTPRRDTVEYLTGDDKFHFSVKVVLPVFGHLITYEGWLEDVDDISRGLLNARSSG
ncbi:DUF4166 domain-containing protein [Agrobacterium salinitolerans]|nr:DUF4166 domain-containing protein [Agrobacterium salinitolerans]